jgi:1-aminocyclopropane-1-carboxylate deaminase/D-cysteine desulfhydrase-like pyridoxal-dependent ACC family enzyme
MITFGGAYSNHIIATAYAGALNGITTIGVIRGERPPVLSHTLLDAMNYGMQLHFEPKAAFGKRNFAELIRKLNTIYPGHFFIPEGGAGDCGEKGCEEILSLLPANDYTHIACAIGTGTMFLGLANASNLYQELIGIPVLKLENFLEQYCERLRDPAKHLYCRIYYDYHFGGYAKHNSALINFMNEFYTSVGVPTDFVYTGKLLYGLTELIKKGLYPKGSSILVIHSGGLQGNRSLPEGTLIF